MENINEIKKCCFTGYRPSKMPFKIHPNDVDFILFEKRITNTLKALIEDNCKVFYTGMAMGFDILSAYIVLALKKDYPDIKLICAIPFLKQSDSFSSFWKRKYDFILENCDQKVIILDSYSAGCYQKRNIFMVDNSDFVVTWYDGQAGGTRNTLKYAEKMHRYIININTNYLDEFNNNQLMMNF